MSESSETEALGVGWPVNTEACPETSVVCGAVQQRGMFIQMQPTPNPASMMFLPGQAVMEVWGL